MNENIIKRLGALMSVKSSVTLALTAVFAYLAVTGQIAQDFMTVYAVVIAFYFGTQSQKIQDQLAFQSHLPSLNPHMLRFLRGPQKVYRQNNR